MIEVINILLLLHIVKKHLEKYNNKIEPFGYALSQTLNLGFNPLDGLLCLKLTLQYL